MKRSNKPIFWSLFGAGGMLAALVGPMLVFITGIAVPGGLLPPATMRYENVLGLARNGFGKIAILLVISLFLFHGMHRLYHTLHDFGIPIGPGIKALCHGFAFAATLVAAYLLFALGFSG